MNNKVGVLIQARMGSTRLPKKMGMGLSGKPLIEWVLESAKKSKEANEVVLCTTDLERDDYLVEEAQRLGVKTFRGDENNVLQRFVNAAKKYEIDTVVRVCADNPLLNAKAIDELITFFKSNDCEYSFNHIPALDNNWPDGFGAEITTLSLLEKILNNKNSTKEHKEHVTKYIWENKDKYNFQVFKSSFSKDYTQVKLDIDTKEDFEKINSFLSYLNKKNISTDSMKQVCEGYLKLYNLI